MKLEQPPSVNAEMRGFIELADGLTLSQVCSLTGLQSSTVQNWVKRGFVPHPVCKRYDGRALARIRIITLLRDSMRLEQIGELLRIVNGDTDDVSDDIIAEEDMLRFLEKTIAFFSDGMTVDEAADNSTRAFRGSHSSKLKLKSVLKVMALAYIAREYKKQAETEFRNLKEY